MSEVKLSQRGSIWVGEFRAMASPCEVHIELGSRKRAAQLVEIARGEALRIEAAFSRYRRDNLVHQINNAGGKSVRVDEEMARMIDFADLSYQISDGLFDVTSGVLRQAWQFDGSDRLPSQHSVASLLEHVGWSRVVWENPSFTQPVGMQIDFGGIAKEYAVDRVVTLLREQIAAPFMVNFGGDLHASGAPAGTGFWAVGIESVDQQGSAAKTIQLHRGALCTSGDARRYILKDGVRYGHVLDPTTGWPVVDAPSSVTVAGNTCTEAGILSTLAILKGCEAESFLDEQEVTYWCQRS